MELFAVKCVELAILESLDLFEPDFLNKPIYCLSSSIVVPRVSKLSIMALGVILSSSRILKDAGLMMCLV